MADEPQFSRPWPRIWKFGDLDGPQAQAMEADKRKSVEFRVTWKEEGWPTEPSSVVRSVLYEGDGELSGSTRLIEGPSMEVAEVYFGDTPPRVVATYQGELPKDFYEF